MIVKYLYWYDNFIRRKALLQKQGKDFITKQGFSTAEIVYEGKRLKYKFERLPVYYLGYRAKLLSHAKKQFNGDYDWVSIFTRLDVSQRQIYRNSVLEPFGYYIDLKNAYTTILHILGLITDEVFLKMLDLKDKGHNINRILGMTYLGKKSIIEWSGFSELNSYAEINTATGIFYIARYFVHKLFIELYKKDDFRKVMIARFIDCCIVTRKYSPEQYEERMRYFFTEIFLLELKKINEYVLKNTGFEFFKLYNLEIRDDFFKYFQFHCYPVQSIKYADEGNARKLTFVVVKNGNYIRKTYKSGAMTDTPADRHSFTSAAIFKQKDNKVFNAAYYIDIYKLMDEIGLGYQISEKISELNNTDKEKIPNFVQKIEDFIEENNFKMIDYENISDITQQFPVDF